MRTIENASQTYTVRDETLELRELLNEVERELARLETFVPRHNRRLSDISESRLRSLFVGQDDLAKKVGEIYETLFEAILEVENEDARLRILGVSKAGRV